MMSRRLNLRDRSLLRLITLCVLYVAQGIPYGFVTVTLSLYLAEEGLSAGAIGVFQGMATLPWTFKWAWGPIIDRYGLPAMGRRRPWIILAQVGMIATAFSMAVVPSMSADIVLLGWMVFVHNVFISLQDVSVDALAVDLLREEERGRVSGLMYGSKYFGMFLGGGGLSWVLTRNDFSTVFAVEILILFIILLFPLLIRERAGERLLPWSRGSSQLAIGEGLSDSVLTLFRRLIRAFSLRSTMVAAVIGLLLFIGSGALNPIFDVLMIQDLGWERSELSAISGGYGIFLGLAGSMLGGFLADLLGARTIIAVGSLGTAGCYLGFGLMSPDVLGEGWFSWTNASLVVTYMLASGFLVSLTTVGLFSLYISLSWPVVAGTQFTAYMAILNLSTTIGLWSSGSRFIIELSSGVGGVATVFLFFAVVQAVVTMLLPLIDPHQTRRVLGTSV